MTRYRATRQADGALVVHDVPVFAECERGKFKADAEWIGDAVAYAKRAEVEGYFIPLHVNHHDFKGRENPPEVLAAGFVRITRAGPITLQGRDRVAVYADLVVTNPEVQAWVLQHRLPYRSVEVLNPSEARISSVALLDHEAPFLELPMLAVGDVAPSAAVFRSERVRNPWHESERRELVECFDVTGGGLVAVTAGGSDDAVALASEPGSALGKSRLVKTSHSKRKLSANEIMQRASAPAKHLDADARTRFESAHRQMVKLAVTLREARAAAPEGSEQARAIEQYTDGLVQGAGFLAVANHPNSTPREVGEALLNAQSEFRRFQGLADEHVAKGKPAAKGSEKRETRSSGSKTSGGDKPEAKGDKPAADDKHGPGVRHDTKTGRFMPGNMQAQPMKNPIVKLTYLTASGAVALQDEPKDPPEGGDGGEGEAPAEMAADDKPHAEPDGDEPGSGGDKAPDGDGDEGGDVLDAIAGDESAGDEASVNLAAILDLIKSGAIPVADLEAIKSAIIELQESVGANATPGAPAGALASTPAPNSPAPPQPVGDALHATPAAGAVAASARATPPGAAAPDSTAIAFAAAQGEITALRAQLAQRDAVKLRDDDVAKAVKRLAGRPLGADIEGKLRAFHDAHGPQAFAAHVSAIETTFAAVSATAGELPVNPNEANTDPAAMAFAADGPEALELAQAFSRQFDELQEHGMTRHTREAFVASMMDLHKRNNARSAQE